MQFDYSKWAKLGPLTLGAVLVTACSNSNSTSTPPPPPANVAPTVQVGDNISADEQTNITLSATATDSDGSIATYSWVQTGGTSVTLTGEDTADLDFTAPVAKAEETLSFEITVTDDDGATASDSVSVTINPVNEISFQIQGLVWNGAAVPSDVTANFGGDPVTVSTDADGNFTFDIAADEDAGSELIFLQSVSASDTEIVFANIPVTLQSLMDASGGDGTLDSSEDLGVNLTPLSTAYFGMVLQSVGSVTSESDVSNTLGQISAQEVITLATDLKLISENNIVSTKIAFDGHLGLPDDFDDTLEFAKDRIGIINFNNVLRAGGGAADFDTAKLSLLGDEKVVQALGDPLSEFPLTMTMNTSGGFGGFLVSRYTFNADNTAIYSNSNAATDADWSQDSAGVITMTGSGGKALSEVETLTVKNVNGSFQQVRALTITSQVVLKPLLDLSVGTLYEVSRTITQTFPDNPTLPDEDFSQTFEVNLITTDDYLEIDVEALFSGGTEATLLTSFFKNSFNPIPTGVPTLFGEAQRHYNADLISLSRSGTDTNGTATSTFASDLFSNGTWEMVDPKVLKVTFDSTRDGTAVPQEITYEMIGDNLTTVIAFENGAIDGLSNGVFAVQADGQNPASEADAEGFYNFPFGITNNVQNMFVTELKPNNEADLLTLFDSDRDGILESNEFNIRPAVWELDMDGKIIVSEYRFPITRAPGCNPNIHQDCVLNRRTTLDIAERDGADLYVLNELSIIAPASGQTPATEYWYQTTSRHYEYSVTAPVDIASLPPQ